MGPLTSTWCLRMEAKNSYFKRIAQIGNFRNIAFSVAKRHQRLACAYLQSTKFFSEYEVGPCNNPYHMHCLQLLLYSTLILHRQRTCQTGS